MLEGDDSMRKEARSEILALGDAMENCGVFEVIEMCPDCQGSNLNEDKTKCWDCTASDYQGGD